MASGKYLLQGNHFFSNLTIKEESRVVQLLGKPRPRADPTCQSQNFYTFSASHVEPVRLVFLAPVSCWAPASGSLLAHTPLHLPSLPKSHRVRCAEQHLLMQLDPRLYVQPCPKLSKLGDQTTQRNCVSQNLVILSRKRNHKQQHVRQNALFP